MENQHKKKKTLECNNDECAIQDKIEGDNDRNQYVLESQYFDENKTSLMVTNVPNFRERVMEQIKTITNLIDCTNKQKKIILSKSKEILNAHILRAERNEIIIQKNTNIKIVASTIIWTVALSIENMPKITRKGIVKLAKLKKKSINNISRYYIKYFKNLYPKKVRYVDKFRQQNIKKWTNTNKIIKYKTINFLKDLVRNSPFAYKTDLSKFLGHGQGYINKKMHDADKNPTLLYGKDLILEWKGKLDRQGFLTSQLEEIFNHYLENTLPINNKMQIFKTDPRINLNYFKNIDSIEKFYWLGWLFAEAWISVVQKINRNSQDYYFGIEVECNDMILIKRFIKAIEMNPYKVVVNKRHDKKDYYMVRVMFSSELFVSNLVNNGFPVASRHTEKKSGVIRMPYFNDRSLALAFLLGYFDGDGSISSGYRFRPRITSKSKEFIKDIQDYFNISYNIETYQYIKDDGNIGKSFKLELPRHLFNQMMDLEIDSLDRKRYYFAE